MMNVLLGFKKTSKFSNLESQIKDLFSAVTFSYCFNTFDGVLLVDKNDFDLAILAPFEQEFDGIDLANRIHMVSPRTKVLFVSDSEKYAFKAFKTRAKGYLVNPSKNEIKEELTEIGIFKEDNKASCVTFGSFDLYANNKIVKFSKSKSKELLAFLVYKKGTSATSSELIVNLWEDKDVDRTTRSMLHNHLSDIKKTLTEYGISDIFEYDRNSYRINKDKITCDYFDFLKGDKKAVQSYTGEFMSEYEWGMFIEPELNSMKAKFKY